MAASDSVREAVRKRASHLCEYCHASEHFQFVLFTMDHVRPQSEGGGDDADNLALACRNCNERRGNRTRVTNTATGEEVALFNPRTDEWNEHFAWDSSTLRIIGITAVGRATVELLDMNDDHHDGRVVRVRQRDRDDGYHPPPEDSVLQS